MDLTELLAKECFACTKKTQRFDIEQSKFYLKILPKWRLSEEKLERKIGTKDFEQALIIANQIGEIAKRQNHHPDLHISWHNLKIEIYTHSIQGLSENDFILAAKIDELIDG